MNPPFKILLIGDHCHDIYRYGHVERISPEAPVPILRISHEEIKPGMAGNVKNNLEALGCEVIYLHGETNYKTRLIDIKSRQHVLRLDNDVLSKQICAQHAVANLQAVSAVVISDYCKGTVSYDLVKEIRTQFKGPIFVDTKKRDLAQFEGCYVKVNAQERSYSTSICTNLIITKGDEGAEYNGILYPAEKIEVVDVCGAGDTFISSLTYNYLKTTDIISSIKFAIKASAITVQHHGVYAPTLDEIK